MGSYLWMSPKNEMKNLTHSPLTQEQPGKKNSFYIEIEKNIFINGKEKSKKLKKILYFLQKNE